MKNGWALFSLLTCLAAGCPGAATAATPFDIGKKGGSPQVAVDADGNGHFVWNREVINGPDVTHYCKIPPRETTCAVKKTFVPPGQDPRNNTDFDGPRVLLNGRVVLVVTHRCCGGFGPAASDGIIVYRSRNGGKTFGARQVLGNQNIAGDAILGPTGAFSTISDVVTGGTFYQAHRPGAFATQSANLGDSGPSQSYNGSLAMIDATTPIATFDDLTTTFWRRYSGAGSYNDVASWTATASVGPGDEGRLAYGPNGVWLLYRVGSPGNTAFVARKFSGAGFGQPVDVTETGDPAFADYFEDSAGRLHALWLRGDRALMYRRSDDGTSYGRTTKLADPTGIFNIEVSAGADGEGWAVWDENGDRGQVHAVALEITPEPPAVGKTVNVRVVKGDVLIKLPSKKSARASQKGTEFVPLTAVRSIPVRSIVDTSDGTVKLSSARSKKGKVQSGKFYAGVFQVFQSRKKKEKGLTELRLKGSSFKSCRTGKSKSKSSARVARKLSRRTIRRLRGNAKGRYRTRGRHSAATVRGTKWTVADRCDGTLTKVSRGKVTVRDFRRHKTIVLKRGKRYLARAR